MNKPISAVNKIDELWRQSVENTRRLLSCPRHVYDMRAYSSGSFTSKYLECARCKGRHPTPQALAYIEGYVCAGAKQSDLVINLTVPLRSDWCLCPRCGGKSAPDDPRAWTEDECALCLSVGSLPRSVAIDWLNNPKHK